MIIENSESKRHGSDTKWRQCSNTKNPVEILQIILKLYVILPCGVIFIHHDIKLHVAIRIISMWTWKQMKLKREIPKSVLVCVIQSGFDIWYITG